VATIGVAELTEAIKRVALVAVSGCAHRLRVPVDAGAPSWLTGPAKEEPTCNWG
jgi:hypothetical protein